MGLCLQPKGLDRQTFPYDFRETSSSSHQSVVKKVNKADFSASGFDHQGESFHRAVQLCGTLADPLNGAVVGMQAHICASRRTGMPT